MNKKGFWPFGGKKKKKVVKAVLSETEAAANVLNEEVIRKEVQKKYAFLNKKCYDQWNQKVSRVAGVDVRKTIGNDYYWNYRGVDGDVKLTSEEKDRLSGKYPHFKPIAGDHVIRINFSTERRAYVKEESSTTKNSHSQVAGDYLGGSSEKVVYTKEQLKGENRVYVKLVPGYEKGSMIWVMMSNSVKNEYYNFGLLHGDESDQLQLIFEAFVKANGTYYK